MVKPMRVGYVPATALCITEVKKTQQNKNKKTPKQTKKPTQNHQQKTNKPQKPAIKYAVIKRYMSNSLALV